MIFLTFSFSTNFTRKSHVATNEPQLNHPDNGINDNNHAAESQSVSNPITVLIKANIHSPDHIKVEKLLIKYHEQLSNAERGAEKSKALEKKTSELRKTVIAKDAKLDEMQGKMTLLKKRTQVHREKNTELEKRVEQLEYDLIMARYCQSAAEYREWRVKEIRSTAEGKLRKLKKEMKSYIVRVGEILGSGKMKPPSTKNWEEEKRKWEESAALLGEILEEDEEEDYDDEEEDEYAELYK